MGDRVGALAPGDLDEVMERTVRALRGGDLVVRGTRDVEQITIWLASVPSLVSTVSVALPL